MWTEIRRYLRRYPSAVLSGLDSAGRPFSLRCHPFHHDQTDRQQHQRHSAYPHSVQKDRRPVAELERALGRGEFFVAYLTTFPESLSINHGVLVYAQERTSGRGERAQKLRYRVYDPNHPDGPRILEWSQRASCFLYQRDWDFVGGRVVVWQVYGRFLQ